MKGKTKQRKNQRKIRRIHSFHQLPLYKKRGIDKSIPLFYVASPKRALNKRKFFQRIVIFVSDLSKQKNREKFIDPNFNRYPFYRYHHNGRSIRSLYISLYIRYHLAPRIYRIYKPDSIWQKVSIRYYSCSTWQEPVPYFWLYFPSLDNYHITSKRLLSSLTLFTSSHVPSRNFIRHPKNRP